MDLHDPKVFGPVFWKTYDIVVDTYPKHPDKKHREAVKMFFRSQKYVIPCASCAQNYRKIYKNHPPQVESRQALQKWLALLKAKVAEHVAAKKSE